MIRLIDEDIIGEKKCGVACYFLIKSLRILPDLKRT